MAAAETCVTGRNNSLDSLVKNAFQVPLRQGAALEVFDGPDLFGDLDGLFVLDGSHLALTQLLPHLGVVAQIELGADEDDGHAGGVMLYFGEPLHRASVSIRYRADGLAREIGNRPLP